jgi:hypothetical protein
MCKFWIKRCLERSPCPADPKRSEPPPSPDRTDYARPSLQAASPDPDQTASAGTAKRYTLGRTIILPARCCCFSSWKAIRIHLLLNSDPSTNCVLAFESSEQKLRTNSKDVYTGFAKFVVTANADQKGPVSPETYIVQYFIKYWTDTPGYSVPSMPEYP